MKCNKTAVCLVVMLMLVLGLGLVQVEAKASTGQISLDVRNADLRDVLSALALKTNLNIVLIEEPSQVTFFVDNVSPMKALELLLQSEGLSYIKEGKLLVIGKPQKLQENSFGETTLTRFDLLYINTRQFQPLLTTLGLPVKSIVLKENPYAIWVQGTPQNLVKVKELLAAVDLPENADESEDEGLALDYGELTTYAVEPTRLAQLVKQGGVPLKNYITFGNRLLVFDEAILKQWDQFHRIIIEIDRLEARGRSIFPFSLQNIVARDAAARLAVFDYPDVKTVIFNFPEYSHELIVICPPELESQVYTSLVSIDVKKERIKAPITSAKGEFARRELQAKRKLLAEMTSVSINNMYISDNLSGNAANPHHVLWVHEAPDQIRFLKDLVDSFDQE